MSITRRVSFLGKMATLWVTMVVAILCTALGALFLFAAALLIWLDHHVGPAAATAMTGLALALAAIVIFICGQLALKNTRAKQPALHRDALGLLGPILRLLSLVVRRSPRKSLIAAIILGAMADYLTSNPTPKE